MKSRHLLLLLVMVMPPCFAGVAFVGVDVVHPATKRIDADQTVLIDGGVIRAMGPAASLELPARTTRIDGDGQYLLAGLAEMHAHVPLAAEGQAYLEDVLFLWVANGITTIRGMRGEASHLQLRERLARGKLLGPRLYTAGPPFIGRSVRSPDMARQRVREQADAGYDFLKVHMALERPVYDAIVDEARRHTIRFAGHVASEVGLERALNAGQSSIEHLDGYMAALVPAGTAATFEEGGLMGAELAEYVDRSLIAGVAEQTARSGAWNAPTLSMVENFLRPVIEGDRPELVYMPPKMVRGWLGAAQGYQKSNATDAAWVKQVLEIRQQLVAALHRAGAGLLLASDAPQILNVPGFSMHREMQLMHEAGLTPAEVLTAATVNPARFLGAEHLFGRIAVGLDADLILLAKNPLEDLQTLQKPVGVMLRGRWLPRADIDDGLAAIAARHGGSTKP